MAWNGETDFAKRVGGYPGMALIAEAGATAEPNLTQDLSAEHWIAEFNAAGIPCGPVLTIDKVFADPQVQCLDMAVPVRHPTLGEIRLTGQAAKMERTPASIRTATPERGEHTEDVLTELGYDTALIRDLRVRQVV